MGDQSQDIKKKGTYETWTYEETKLLLDLMVDGVKRSWLDHNGNLNRRTVEERILPKLNSKLGIEKTYKNYTSKYKWFKGRWTSISNLMRFSSGFGYDPNTKMFTAPEEVWNDYLKAHPDDTDLRTKMWDDYEDLKIVFGKGVATGKSAIGLGSSTDARICKGKEVREPIIEDFEYDVEQGGFVISNEDETIHESTPGSPNNSDFLSQEERPSKRSKIEHQEKPTQCTTQDTLNNISKSIGGVYDLLAKREKERQYTLWDAVKEVPNLENNTRFKIMKLLNNNKDMKDMFFKMSLEERLSWIIYETGE